MTRTQTVCIVTLRFLWIACAITCAVGVIMTIAAGSHSVLFMTMVTSGLYWAFSRLAKALWPQFRRP